MNITHSLVPATVAVTAVLVAVGSPATAKDKDGRVSASGSCSSGATWKVKASPEDGRLEAEGEVDSNRAGQTWWWSLKQNGTGIANSKSRTKGRSGSFEVRKVTRDRSGTDTFVFTARRSGTSVVCRGVVRI
jgi:hypothetical protein